MMVNQNPLCNLLLIKLLPKRLLLRLIYLISLHLVSQNPKKQIGDLLIILVKSRKTKRKPFQKKNGRKRKRNCWLKEKQRIRLDLDYIDRKPKENRYCIFLQPALMNGAELCLRKQVLEHLDSYEVEQWQWKKDPHDILSINFMRKHGQANLFAWMTEQGIQMSETDPPRLEPDAFDPDFVYFLNFHILKMEQQVRKMLLSLLVMVLSILII
ncbi:unnamed protein product [Paramecium octaurelia]|uniref:Uncharacterized protein n=1 Tax=Paramecium octaurelia TaxID=43137 RepID=A0A8S1T070_PAROT|nr:unnamed protein product [Paramecium octaurelia]